MMDNPKIVLNRTIINGEIVITIEFEYNIELIQLIKTIEGVRWNNDIKCWTIPEHLFSERKLPKNLKKVWPELELYHSNKTESNIQNNYLRYIHVEHLTNKKLFRIKSHYNWKESIKQLDGAWWSSNEKRWYCDSTNDNYSRIKVLKKEHNLIIRYTRKAENVNKRQDNPINNLELLNESKQKAVNDFRAWMKQRRFSINTIKTYCSCIEIFFRYYNQKQIDEITVTDIEKFNYDFIIENNYSQSTQSQYISAVKLFYLKMDGSKLGLESLERPPKRQRLPKVIAKQDIEKMLKKINNQKHKTALTVIYSLGLRRSELLNLKLIDICFKRHIVQIKNSKGNKDRDLPLPYSLEKVIRNYIELYEPKEYLIEGHKAGKPYSATSLENIFHKNLDRVIKNNNFTLHSLRHSYATHLMDMGVDLRIIQELLGHKSSRTTEIYTHVSMVNLKNIKNPLNDLNI